MIRPLRQRHRVIVCALGVILPVAFTLGLAARKAVPSVKTVPASLLGRVGDAGPILWRQSEIWTDPRFLTTLRRDAAGALTVEFSFRDLARSDVLVYWVKGKEGGGLQDDARLLGALLQSVPRTLPKEIRGETGRFVLYSLADQEVVAQSKAFVVPNE